MKQIAELLVQALVATPGSSRTQDAIAMSGDFEYRNGMGGDGNR